MLMYLDIGLVIADLLRLVHVRIYPSVNSQAELVTLALDFVPGMLFVLLARSGIRLSKQTSG